MNDLTVREAIQDDLDDVAKVNQLATEDLRKVYRPTSVVSGKAQIPTTRLVAEKEGKIVGTLRYSVNEDRLHIIGLMVHPSYRHQGVARAMIDTLAEIAQKECISRLTLYTICQTGNVEIFSRLGFAKVSEEPADWAKSTDGQSLTEAYMEKLI